MAEQASVLIAYFGGTALDWIKIFGPEAVLTNLLSHISKGCHSNRVARTNTQYIDQGIVTLFMKRPYDFGENPSPIASFDIKGICDYIAGLVPPEYKVSIRQLALW